MSDDSADDDDDANAERHIHIQRGLLCPPPIT